MADQQENLPNADQLDLALNLTCLRRDQLIASLNQLSTILRFKRPMPYNTKLIISRKIDESIKFLVELSPFNLIQLPTNDSAVVERIISGQLIVGLSRAERSSVVNHLIAVKDVLLFDDSAADETKRKLVAENRRILHRLLELPCREHSDVIGRYADEFNGKSLPKKQRVGTEISGPPGEFDWKALIESQEEQITRLETGMSDLKRELKRKIEEVDTTRAEAAFKFVLSDVSKLLEIDGNKTHSDTFWCRGLQWSIYVECSCKNGRSKHLGFYLYNHNADLLKWFCRVNCKLTLFNNLPNKQDYFRKCSLSFKQKAGLGYRHCISYFELADEMGLIKDDKIKMEVELKAEQIYNWWKNYKRIQYPCSLFLTLTTVSIRELSNQKHPIHLRILNKSIIQQYINQRRLLDFNEGLNQGLVQQQADLDQAARQPQALNYPIRNLKQFQQVQTNNSSLEDQAEPPHPPYSQAMAMPSGHLHGAAAVAASTQQQTFHQTTLPAAQPTSMQQTAAQRQQSASVLSNWNKSSGGSTNSQQHCKLPSSTWHQLSAGNNKCCYNVAFSNDGTKIACCASVFTAYMSNEKRSSIFIYDLPAGSFLQRVNGFHSAPIYYLDWSKNDKLLASASADCTCLVWQMRRAHCAPLCLTHPCFVYTVKFHPNNHYQLATGAFDGAVRLWCIQESLKSTIKEPILLQCVAATGSVAAATFHGQVLALCWMHCLVDYIGPNGPEQKNELLLFSGCSRGNLMALKQDELSLSWQPSKKMKIKEITNLAINEIQCCPNDSRFIILFCRDGVQRMVDIFSETITMRYIGSLNFNHLIRGCLSTDGKFLFAGSEDAIVHVWNVDTGERIYTYNNLPFRGSIASINYHPHEDIIAISGLNARTISVCLYKHHSRELPSPKPKQSPDPNYLQSAAASSQPIAKASMVTSNPSGHTTVSFARDEYKQDEYMMTNKSVGSLASATERTRLTKNKPELKKSHTIDHSSNSSSTSMPSKANQKVQKAMRKLELALRLSFNEKS